MPQKKGSKPIWVDGAIHAAFRERLRLEGWTWGMTKKVESLLAAYTDGKLIRSEPTQEKPPLRGEIVGFEVHDQSGHGLSEDQPDRKKARKRDRRQE